MAVLRAGLRGSFLYSSAVKKQSQVSGVLREAHVCVLSADVHVPLISSFDIPCSSSAIKLRYRNKDTEGENVQAARVVASELMPYAMTRPVMKNRFSSPFSLKKCILRWRARARASHPGRVGGVLGYRTGSVERPHGLDCD